MFNPFGSVSPLVLVTRFSVFSAKAGGLRIRQEFGNDLDEFEKRLFDSGRLNTRLDILTKLALPGYEQANRLGNVVHLVQYSSNLPERYIVELNRAAQRYDFFKPVLVEDETMYDSVINEVRSWGPSFCGTFAWGRVDDDDLLSQSFFKRITKYLNSNFHGMAVSFPKQAATLYSNGLVVDVKSQFVRNPSAGQVYVGFADNNLDMVVAPGFVAHHAVDTIVPTVVDPSIFGSLQMLHSSQDTSSFESPVGGRLINRLSQLSKYAPQSAEFVAEEFPTLLPRTRNAAAAQDGIEFKLLEGQTLNLDTIADPLASDACYRLDFDVQFTGRPSDACSLTFVFDKPDLAVGHFPRTPDRGDYLRLYVDLDGNGSAFFVVPKHSRLKAVRLNVDGDRSQVDFADFRIVRNGDLATA